MTRPRDHAEPAGTAAPTLAARLREIANLIAPTTVLTALLIYFGAVYTDGRLAYYGIQLGLADLTNHDLILYGTEAIYVPIALLLVVLVALGGHAGVTWLLPSARPALFTAAVVVVLGLLATARAAIGILIPAVNAHEPAGLTGLMLAAGPLLLAYAGWVAGRVLTEAPDSRLRRWHAGEQATRVRRMVAVASAVLALTGLFWATNRVAFTLGLTRSYAEAADESGFYRIVLDTKEPLADPPEGVTQTPLPPAAEGGFCCRYRGLRLELESGDRLFLVPEQWTRDTRTLVVPYDENVRIELIPPAKNLNPE